MTDAITATVEHSFPGKTPDQIFRAWIDPDLLPQWLAPDPYDLVHAEIEAVRSGHYRHDIVGPDGKHVVIGEFLRFEPGRRLRKSWNYRGPNPAPRPEPTFVDVIIEQGEGNSSRLILTHHGLRDQVEWNHYDSGWRVCFERLETLDL
ncbi:MULTISPECIES: SRPBCC family protein [unclassified Sphingomonas]|uniref:SRPBCC family protein n=1 Tax=unclassified Sphingomonas TaxID=196159 RepID=UPI0006FC24B3|nr:MULTISPECIES: SRPBCC domain-containing protein [unclassified Sphingomonas]KQX18648.1 activator of HSP90 ATPase [Sphingomonas sp. Root1294]KQY72029.1 activator of HSP90 ATPase [Sphingomonas sp. Root50]KRB94702.1 activator of HSP90 ATPase [Sphingomonas sp. Root720]